MPMKNMPSVLQWFFAGDKTFLHTDKWKLSTAGTEITPFVELISEPNKMNFKSFPFLVHLHNLYIVKVFVRFRLFFGIATLQIILLLCITFWRA